MFKIIAVCICCLLTGCSFFGGKYGVNEQQLYHRVNQAYDFEVTHCDSFAMARGEGRGEFALRDAKNQAMKYAETLNGTHIVWLHIDEGEVVKVVAVIYKCQQ
ncbi:hypothetical protein JK628_00815 [Shewanella sp. KX20019]|uniref:hypothetical protein n=1 Tax=Shewanella sp. KX20019 TaxID=2803864 RepID=UPI0019280165|nr:hypothetical protein [Shewanella sp. KX20019]QQX80455.1 hypothetical protein JK628_00815 [Shewanella sp. KX20019]